LRQEGISSYITWSIFGLAFTSQIHDASGCLKFNHYNIQQQTVERNIELWHNVVNIHKAMTTEQRAREPDFDLAVLSHHALHCFPNV